MRHNGEQGPSASSPLFPGERVRDTARPPPAPFWKQGIALVIPSALMFFALLPFWWIGEGALISVYGSRLPNADWTRLGYLLFFVYTSGAATVGLGVHRLVSKRVWAFRIGMALTLLLFTALVVMLVWYAQFPRFR